MTWLLWARYAVLAALLVAAGAIAWSVVTARD